MSSLNYIPVPGNNHLIVLGKKKEKNSLQKDLIPCKKEYDLLLNRYKDLF